MKNSGGVGDPTEGTLDPMYFLGVKALPPESLQAPAPPTCSEHSIIIRLMIDRFDNIKIHRSNLKE